MAVFEEIFGKKVINCADAGAAGGLKELHSIKKIVNLFSFEPLPDEYFRLKKNRKLTQGIKGHKIYPFALYSAAGRAKLNIAQRPSMSSLLEFDENAFDKYFGYTSGSFAWKEMLKQKDAVEIELITLDKWFEDSGLPRVDFLKLDTQGTELEILKGAVKILSKHKISVIKSEFNNFPVYKNQCLFSELDIFLRSHGFELLECIVYPDTAYQGGQSSVNENRKLFQTPSAGTGGDAVYVLKEEFLNTEEALAAGVVLGSMGYFAAATALLQNRAGLNKTQASQLLGEIAPSKGFRKKVKEFIPPFFVKLLRGFRK